FHDSVGKRTTVTLYRNLPDGGERTPSQPSDRWRREKKRTGSQGRSLREWGACRHWLPRSRESSGAKIDHYAETVRCWRDNRQKPFMSFKVSTEYYLSTKITLDFPESRLSNEQTPPFTREGVRVLQP